MREAMAFVGVALFAGRDAIFFVGFAASGNGNKVIHSEFIGGKLLTTMVADPFAFNLSPPKTFTENLCLCFFFFLVFLASYGKEFRHIFSSGNIFFIGTQVKLSISLYKSLVKKIQGGDCVIKSLKKG